MEGAWRVTFLYLPLGKVLLYGGRTSKKGAYLVRSNLRTNEVWVMMMQDDDVQASKCPHISNDECR
jgi:hypothetical protein